MSEAAIDFDEGPESFETARPAALVKLPDPVHPPARRRPEKPAAVGRTLPHSLEAEEFLLSCCMMDGATVIPRCLDVKISHRSFYEPRNGILFDCIYSLHKRGLPTEIYNVAEELKATKQLDQVGGYAHLTQVTGRIPTTAQASYFIDRVREQATLRELIMAATAAVEGCYNFSGGIEELTADINARLKEIALNGALQPGEDLKSIADYDLLPDTDRSVLLGNRYLNRGDAAVLVSTSGMGKSSMSVQMAVLWALGREAFGIKPNGPMRSLIVQSEDSDGDIAEIWFSIQHVLNLSAEEKGLVRERVKIVNDRVNRGDAFIKMLRRTIKTHKPDLVWINPLQAFIDGDVTDSQDLGRFLREGLNGLNDKCEFGYIIVHHTTKPATGADKPTRLWHEVMYDMAGGAEIINWARAILSLRAAADEGDFNLVLAKRGRRAGVTKRVEQGAGWREEPVTTIALRHAKGFIKIEGRNKDLPIIFWEGRDPDPAPNPGEEGGRPSKHPFADYQSVFPAADTPGLALGPLHRALIQNKDINKKTLHAALDRWIEQGLVQKIELENQPCKYRKAPAL